MNDDLNASPPADGAAVAALLGVPLIGPSRPVTRLVPPGAPEAGGLAVAPDARTAAALLAHEDAPALALAVIPLDAVPDGSSAGPPLLPHPDPRQAFARLTVAFDREPVPAAGIHPTAVVDATAQVATDASVGPLVVIGAHAQVHAGAILEAGCVIGERCTVGAGTRLFPRVVLYPGVTLGRDVRVHGGAVLGADGFGYVSDGERPRRIRHLGSLVVHDRAEIGANACIDRGTLSDTVIGEDAKVDDLSYLGHNVQVGRGCLIVGQAAIGGSTVLGDGVVLGGAVSIRDHVRIGAGARLAARSAVHRDVPANEDWMGVPARPKRAWVRERSLLDAMVAERERKRGRS